MNKLLFVSALLLCFGCHTSEPMRAYDGPNELGAFTYSPVEIAELDFLLSLGWIQPVGHTIPTDHVYFWVKSETQVPVQAPGGGRIQKILLVPVAGLKEVKIWIQ